MLGWDSLFGRRGKSYEGHNYIKKKRIFSFLSDDVLLVVFLGGCMPNETQSSYIRLIGERRL